MLFSNFKQHTLCESLQDDSSVLGGISTEFIFFSVCHSHRSGNFHFSFVWINIKLHFNLPDKIETNTFNSSSPPMLVISKRTVTGHLSNFQRQFVFTQLMVQFNSLFRLLCFGFRYLTWFVFNNECRFTQYLKKFICFAIEFSELTTVIRHRFGQWKRAHIFY